MEDTIFRSRLIKLIYRGYMNTIRKPETVSDKSVKEICPEKTINNVLIKIMPTVMDYFSSTDRRTPW